MKQKNKKVSSIYIQAIRTFFSVSFGEQSKLKKLLPQVLSN